MRCRPEDAAISAGAAAQGVACDADQKRRRRLGRRCRSNGPLVHAERARRLEKAGWAKRLRDPGDRRRVLVEASPKVKALGADVYGPVETAFAQFPDYTEEQLQMLLD